MVKKMNSHERYEAAMASEEVDRIPLAQSHGAWGLSLNNVSIQDSILYPKLAAQAEINVVESCDIDGITTMWDWNSSIAALGGQQGIPSKGTIVTKSHVISDADSLSELEVPDPSKDVRLASAIQTSNLLIGKYGSEKYMFSILPTPYTLAGELRGVEAMTLETIMEPDFVKDIVSFATDIVKSQTKYVIENTGVESIFYPDPTASGSLISPSDFMNFSQPHLKECSEFAQSLDAASIIHICGDTNDRLSDIADIGCEIFSVDSLVNLSLANETIGDRLCLFGNVKPAQTLFSGTPGASYDESMTCIKDAGVTGFILSAGCDLAPDTPLENIQAMHRATCDYEM